MPISRRMWLTGAAALTAGCTRRNPARPNLLLVVADDQSWPHAGAYGDNFVQTPAFDRIAKEGVLFTHSFSVCPSCTPSRTALLTGRHLWQAGEAGVLYGTIPAGLPLLTHSLEDSGYRTGFTGKGWAPGDWRAAGLRRHPNGKEFNTRKHATPVAPGLDDRDYAANFADFLDDGDPSKPFFFWLGSTEPHRLYDPAASDRLGRALNNIRVPSSLPDTGTTRRDMAAYYSEIEWYDQQLGKVLDLLEKRAILDDTLIVVTSDNGMPFPRAKVNLYDGGLRMPLAMRWGRRFRGDRTTSALVSHIDIPSTLLSAAGLPNLPGASGQSLLPLLDGKTDVARGHVLAGLERHTYCRPDGATYPARSVRTRDFLYIRNFEPDRWPTGGPDFVSSNKTFHGDIDGAPVKDELLAPANAKRFARELALCVGKRPAEEFYHLPSDPDQENNIISRDTHREALHQLRALLETDLRATGDPRIEGRDPWKAYPYRQTTGFGASFNSSLSPEARTAAREGAAHKPE
ncbi:MAG: sulfatase [Bryobacterales bacterium]|nr:sulfatase [Bryobacterales bacterium]